MVKAQPELCVAVSEASLQVADRLDTLVSAVTCKEYRSQIPFNVQTVFMDTSINIISDRYAEEIDEHQLWRLLDERGVASFACDIGPAALRVVETSSANGYPRYTLRSDRIDEREYLHRAETNATILRQHFPGSLKLENLNYFPTGDGAYELVCDPGFISRVVAALGAELLLDIGHVQVTCANLGIPAKDYLLGLPMKSVTELQISSSGILNGVWEDLHDPPHEDDLELVDWVCSQAPIRYITIEYYRDPGILLDAYQRVGARLRERVSRPT